MQTRHHSGFYWIDLIVNLIDFQFVEFCSVLSTVFVKMCKRDTADALASIVLDWSDDSEFDLISN